MFSPLSDTHTHTLPCPHTLEEVMTLFKMPMNSGVRISLWTSVAQFFITESST